ncbi:hypothetical protein GCM10027174_28130 [Salinifilum aidingensis]
MTTTSTLTPVDRTPPSTEKPSYRVFEVVVARVHRLSPGFVRITFRGPDLETFGPAGCDQRIKVVLPRAGRDVRDMDTGADWYSTWSAMPEETRPVLRTYTVRAHRRTELGTEVDVDFVLHGDASAGSGPAAAWAARARPGERIGLVGPDRPGRGQAWGCAWSPGTEGGPFLLAGDETAVPAISAILESLPAGATGIACLEVPHGEDRLALAAPPGVELRWFCREHAAAPHGSLLESGVAAALEELLPHGCRESGVPAEPPEVDVDGSLLWEAPERGQGVFYGWLAGEAGVIKRLRRMLVRDCAVPKSAVAFMGYWRAGRSL